MNNKNNNDTAKDTLRKHDADSGNDITNEMLQHENLIDPGNEHNHSEDYNRSDKKPARHDADAGNDGTGTMGSKPE